jgi:NDP-sugar pyrophosphorylase family protein
MTGEASLCGVILAAGFGKRMARLTRRVPKPLLPIVNVPTLERILYAFRDAGVRDVLVITGYRAEAVEAYCGDGSRWDLSIACIRQTEVSGTGSAARLAAAFAGNRPLMLTYGDILLEAHEYEAVARLFFETGCTAASALNRMADVSKGSAVFLDGRRIVRVIEKPPPGTATSNLNNAGLYVFRPAIFDAIDRTPRSARGEYELTEAVQTLIADGAPVMGQVIDGVQYDIGTPEAFLETNLLLIDRLGDHGPAGASQDVLADNFASPNLVVTPPVAVHASAQLERCRLGPGVCLGAEARIGHGATIEHSVILPGADIGDGASLAWSVVGYDASVDNRQILHGRPDAVIIVGEEPEI